MRRTLVMAATLMAAMVVPTVASAQQSSQFSVLDRAIPAELSTVEEIFASMRAALGTEIAAITRIQQECGFPKPTGAMPAGGNTEKCLRTHAETIARARAEARAVKVQRDAMAAQAAVTLNRAAPEKPEAKSAERTPEGICTTVNLSQYVGMCDPVSQNVRCVSKGTGFRLTCVPKSMDVEIVELRPYPNGSADANLSIVPPNGTLGPAALPWQVPPSPPQPLPELPGVCDGVGGALLCYVLPAAAVAVGVLAATGNFVEVQR